MNQNKFVCKPSEKLKVFIPLDLPNAVNDIKSFSSAQNKQCDSLNFLLSHQKKNTKIENKELQLEKKHECDNSNHITNTKMSKSVLNIDLKNTTYDLKMFVKNLEYDLRVKKYNQNENEITIDFYNINSSISFYKQYLCCYDMQFINKVNLNWIDSAKFKDAEMQTNFSIYNNTFFNNLLPFKIVLNSKDEEINDDTKMLTTSSKQKKDLFYQKIKYYTSICKFFTPCEIKKMQIDIENNCYSFVFRFTKELAVGLYTNVFFQEILQNLSQDQLLIIVKNLSYDIAPISCTKYGAYVIQTIIHKCKDTNLQKLTKQYMKPYMIELLQNQIGNYSAQSILSFDEVFVLDVFYKNLIELLNNDLSLKVFKKCYSLFKPNNIEIDKKINDVYNSLHKNKQVDIIAFLQEYSNKKNC